jgi:hypothetical protein
VNIKFILILTISNIANKHRTKSDNQATKSYCNNISMFLVTMNKKIVSH